LSTDEKLGGVWLLLLAPPEALEDEGEAALGEAEDELGEADEELLLGELLLGEADEELEAPPEALPEDLLSVALGLALDPVAPLLSGLVLCAAATPASAKSAAAVAVTTTFNVMWEFLLEIGENCRDQRCNEHACAQRRRHGFSFTAASCNRET
jgi:hypothetical protein